MSQLDSKPAEDLPPDRRERKKARTRRDLVEAAVRLFDERGFEPSGHLRWDPGRKWRDLAPGELYPRGLGQDQDVESLYRQVRARCPGEADGVLVAGTGVRCVGVIDALEQDLARPVLTANQASLWHCLRRAGVHARVTGYGGLLGL